MKLPEELLIKDIDQYALPPTIEAIVRDCAECAKSFPGEFVNSTTQRQATANAILKRYGLT